MDDLELADASLVNLSFKHWFVRICRELSAVYPGLSHPYTIADFHLWEDEPEDGLTTLDGRQDSYIESERRVIVNRKKVKVGNVTRLASRSRERLVRVPARALCVSLQGREENGEYIVVISFNGISLSPYKAEVQTPDHYYSVYLIILRPEGKMHLEEIETGTVAQLPNDVQIIEDDETDQNGSAHVG